MAAQPLFGCHTMSDEVETIFAGKKVKMSYGMSDAPIVCTVLGVIEEPDSFFYHVEFEDGSNTYIAVSGVDWITVIKDQEKRKKILKLEPSTKKV